MITALAIAVGAALFTVLGFRELFEPSIKTTYMAVGIEVGKIICLSALYQFRNIISWFWKGILLLLVLVAMAITSAGIYGYLSSAYQRDSLNITQNEQRLEIISSRKEQLESRLENIDEQISNVPETYVTKRMELIETFGPEKDSIITELNELARQESDLKIERIEQETEFGAIILLANAIEWMDTSKAMLYFILAVIFIFDPMAVVLTYLANVGFAHASTKSDQQKETINEADTNDMITELRNNQETTKEELAKALNSLNQKLEDISGSETESPRANILDQMRKA